MSFTLIIAVTAAVAASMGYMAARKTGEGGKGAPEPEGGDGEAPKLPAAKEPAPAKKPPKAEPKKESSFATLPFALGDVVTSASEERWLSGAIVAREGGRVIGALFVAPEGATHQAVAVFAPPRKDIYWMSPAELASPDEPPATIELGGVALARKGRLPVSLERHGQGAPQVDAEGIWAVYDRSGRDVALVLSSAGRAHAWVGRRLEEDEYDRLGGGGDGD